METTASEIKRTHHTLSEWLATSICGNDILSSAFYVSGISIVYAGVYAPFVLLAIALVLFFYKSVYTEVVGALPTNGGAYNCLLNATSKPLAAIAGTTTILSYIATAVISGVSAMSYLHSIVPLSIVPWTVGLLGAFAVLVVSGIKDSAKVAFGIFMLHIGVLTMFVLAGALYAMNGGHAYLGENLNATLPILDRVGGLVPALVFGFAASLLGVSGFESSANFVEEQKKGVFEKTLRNMLIGVAIFNPLIALVSLNSMPYAAIIQDKDFLLSNVAHVLGGPVLQYIIVIDAVLVLSGAVLTAFVGVSGLIFRMTTDGCFPEFIGKKNSKGSYPYIIAIFFACCVSILIVAGGDLLVLAGVYTIAFLSVMTLFALGNLLMRETRKDLKRPFRAPLIFVLLAFGSTMLGILGNIRLNPENLHYFAVYFTPSVIIVLTMVYIDYVAKYLLRLFKPIPGLNAFFAHRFASIASRRYVVFIRDIGRLYAILSYIDRNETGRTIYLVHCAPVEALHAGTESADIAHAVQVLQQCGVCPQFNIETYTRREAFSPIVVDSVSREFGIPKNRILIGSIHDSHHFNYEEFGGARIIF